MLVISRKCDQEVLIGGRIRLRILSVRGNRVQLGIDAPLEVPVHRAENLTRFEDGRCGDPCCEPCGEPASVGVPA